MNTWAERRRPGNRTAEVILALVALLAAFGTRVYQLGFRTLIGDEAYSALAGQGSLRSLFAIYDSSEPHPPAHYLTLYVWERLSGSSEFAVRFPSAVAGVLLVAVMLAIGRRALPPVGAALAAVFVATSPYLIAQSQLARGYALTALALALALLALIRVVELPNRRRWAGYVVFCWLALYSHTFAALAVAAYPLWFVFLPPATRKRIGLRPWVTAHLIVGVGYLPWLARVVSLLRNPAPMWFEEGSLPRLGWQVLRVFAVGPSAPPTVASVAAAALVLLVGVGLVATIQRSGLVTPRGLTRPDTHTASNLGSLEGHPRRLTPAGRLAHGGRGLATLDRDVNVHDAQTGALTLLPALTLLVPATLALLLSLRAPILRDRYMIVLFVPLALLVGMALAEVIGRWRVLRVLALLVVVAPSTVALPAYYGNVDFTTAQQMRELRQFVRTAAGPDLAVVVTLDPADPYFQYYDLAPAEVVYVPIASNERRQAGERKLSELVSTRSRIWLIPFAYGPPEARFAEPMLDSLAYRLDERWFGNLRVVRYASVSTTNAPTRSVEETLRGEGGLITLVAYQVSADRLPSGGALGLGLTWRAETTPTERLKVFVHLIDAAGMLWAQNDAEPQAGRFPTTDWTPGQPVEDHYGIPIPAGAPPGAYTLRVGLYRPSDGRRLERSNGENYVDLGPIAVERPTQPVTVEAASLRYPVDRTWDDALTLLGYDIDRPDGANPVVALRPGEELPLTLLWRAHGSIGDYQIRLELLSTDGRAVTATDGLPAGPTYPPRSWTADETVLGKHRLKLPTDASLGRYTLAISARVDGADAWSPERRQTLHEVEVIAP